MKRGLISFGLALIIFSHLAVAQTCTISAEDPVYDSTTADVGTTRSVSTTFKCSASSTTATITFVPDNPSLTAVTDSGGSQYEGVSITTSGVTKTFYMSASAAGSYGFYVKATESGGGGAQTSTNYIQYVNPESLTMDLTEDPSGTYNATNTIGIVVDVTNHLASSQTRNLTLWFSGGSFTVAGDPQTQTLNLAGSSTQQVIWNVTLTGLSGTMYAYVRLGDNTQAAMITLTKWTATTTTTTTTTTTQPGYAATTTTITPTTTTTTPLLTEETQIVESVVAGNAATFEFEEANKLKIESISIIAKNTLSNIAVIAKESALPSGVSAPVPSSVGSVYKYIEITKSHFTDEDITKATIKFKVEKPWIITNEINENKVYLYRYADNTWEKLTTRKLNSDTNYVYYETESAGLSLFAIGGEKLPSATTTTTRPKVGIQIGETRVWGVIVIVVATTIAIVIVLYKKRIISF